MKSFTDLWHAIILCERDSTHLPYQTVPMSEDQDQVEQQERVYNEIFLQVELIYE